MTGMVLVDAGTYEQLTAHAAALKAREQSVLDLGNQAGRTRRSRCGGVEPSPLPKCASDRSLIDWHTMPTIFEENPMPTRNVVLTDHQALLVEQLVASGRYQNASEVLREGLRLVEQREAEDAYRLEALRSAVRGGIADISAGRYKTFESRDALRAHLKSITARAITKA